jgi:hypothetical protein
VNLNKTRRPGFFLLLVAGMICLVDCSSPDRSQPSAGPAAGRAQSNRANGAPAAAQKSSPHDDTISNNVVRMMREGRETFRNDTFGSEAFWGDVLGLHEAIEGSDSKNLGGVSPKVALAVGLKVDADALPAELADRVRSGAVNMDDPATTVALLQLNAVVGVRGFFAEKGRLRSVGITCALCHSTVDDSFSPGIGRRLDGWANRDLNVGKIVSLAPNLEPIAKMLNTNVLMVKQVLESWGPGKYDAQLDKDGQAFRPDGKSSAVLLPAAFGLAGVNLHTYTGMGSVPYWNAYVATTQMHGQGTYFDERLKEAPVAARTSSWNTRAKTDLVTSKLAALHFYQLSIPAPTAPSGSFDPAAFSRGQKLFEGKAKCATCHVPPLYTEPGNNIHTPAEIGIDDFQAERSPTKGYRTTPLRGLWSHQKSGFYHDGRFPTLADVVAHYDRHLKLELSDAERKDLIQFLLGL